jgi:protein KRI1
MGKVKLDLGDESSDDGLKINKDYADKYEQWRSKEVLQKLKDKFKNKPVEEENNEEEDDSTSESEPEWTADDEKGFLRALGALKSNDPKIYDKTQKFFIGKSENGTAENGKPKKAKESEKKGMTLRDYEVALVTEREGKFDDEDVMEEPQDEGYHKKNQRLKEEFKAVALNDTDESEDENGFMKKREKTVEQKKKEEEDYAEWLKGEGKEIDISPDDDIKKLKTAWNKPELDENEQFLRDYLLNKKYDVDDNEDPEAPTYDDIVQDEAEIEKADNFEHKYNFRFEEPDHDFIKQFPRTVKESIRKGNEKRKEKREEIKKRKDEELQQKKEEIKLLKTLKKKEIEEKLKKVKAIAGDDALPMSIEDLEKDFDPKEYDKRMQEIFAKKYYDEEGDNEKPIFTDDSEDEESDYDNMQVGIGNEDAEDGNDEEDGQEEDEEAGRSDKASNRKKKRNSKFKEVIHKKKPIFDPNEKTFEDYFAEYYSLDYEDIIADNLRTKFKYRNVPANNYALSTEEILTADDKQLNQWVSVKKASQYRSEKDEDYDRKIYEQKAQSGKKDKILAKKNDSLDKPVASQTKAKNPSKKMPQQKQQQEELVEDVPSKRKNRRKNKSTKKTAFQNSNQKIDGVQISRLKAYNVSNKSLKRKIYGNANSTTAAKKPKTT